MAKKVKSVTLESVAKKVDALFTYETTKAAAAKSLQLTPRAFDQKVEQVYVIGKIDSNANRLTNCSLYYLKKASLKAMKSKDLPFADASVCGLVLSELREVLSFKDKQAVERCKKIFNLEEDNVAKVIIWAAIQGDKMEKLFERARLAGIYLRNQGE